MRYKVDERLPEASLGRGAADPLVQVALGTAVAWQLFMLSTLQAKAIVLDCDNILWSRESGEQDPHDLELKLLRHIELQRVAARQAERGVLICLCSKNAEENAFRGAGNVPT